MAHRQQARNNANRAPADAVFVPIFKGFARALAFVLVIGAEFASAEVGRVLFVAGEVKIVASAGTERVGRKDEAIAEGETLLTSALASVQIKLADGGFLLVRPESNLRLDKFEPGGAGEQSAEATLSLSKGAFRVSHPAGESARTPILQIVTPLTTVTLKGNDFECMFVAAPAPADPPGLSPGLYVKTLARTASLTSGKQAVDVRINQAWHVPDANSAPVQLDAMPEFQRRVVLPASDPTATSAEGYRVGASADKSLQGAGAATSAHGSTVTGASQGASYSPAMQQIANDRMNSFSNRMLPNPNIIVNPAIPPGFVSPTLPVTGPQR